MKFLLIIIFQTLILGKRTFANKSSIDVILSKRYEFGLFENFDRCLQLYKQEEKVTTQLKTVKERLSRLMTNLRPHGYDNLTHYIYLRKNMKVCSFQLNISDGSNNVQSSIFEYSKPKNWCLNSTAKI